MKTIAWLLTRMILMRFLVILIGLSVFVITLDLITFVDQVLKLDDNAAVAMINYVAHRLPGTASTFMAMSVLLALLLTLIELSYRNEVTAIWAAGIPPWRLLLMLMPLGCLLGGLNFLINDQAVPRLAPTLQQWGIGDYGKKQLNVGDKDPIWMRAGTDILRAGNSNADATELENVIIFRRDSNGLLVEQVIAKRAVLNGSRWELFDAVIYYQRNLLPNRVEKLIYSGQMRPAAAGARSGDPEEMSLTDLDYFIDNKGFGIRPAHVYETWWHKRLTLFLSSWLMICVCVPLAVRFRRGGGIGMLFGIGIAVGFGFFIFDGISLTMGELGLVPSWMAAWTPVIAFGGLAASLLFRAETVS